MFLYYLYIYIYITYIGVYIAVVLASLEVEVGRIEIQSQPRQQVHKTLLESKADLVMHVCHPSYA
jgi:hypothetical protein